MASAFQLLLGAAIFASMTMTAQAQPAPPAPPPVPDGPRYVVTYVEVMPTAKDEGAALVRQFRDAGRKEAGNLRLEAARRLGFPNQFVILEAWKERSGADHDPDVLRRPAFERRTIDGAGEGDRDLVAALGPGAFALVGKWPILRRNPLQALRDIGVVDLGVVVWFND